VPSHCPQRTVLGIVGRHGVFARYLTLPLANLHPVPDEVDDERAVFTEPLAAAVEVMQQIQLKPTDRVLVVGAGRLGQLIAAVLAGTGAELWALVRHDRPLPLLVAHGVATCREANLGELGPFDVTVEASGSPAGFALAVGAVRPRGRVVLKSTYAGQLTVDASALVVQEITLVGSRCGPFAPALRRLALGLDPRPLISGRYPLSQGLEAFGQAGDVGGRKVLLD
jgi:threonine dehydrogenase-like Zn-dependent dehydrogenase